MTNKRLLVERGYKFIIEQNVVWGDMDAMQHVNNTNYFRYCETARLSFIRLMFPDFCTDGLESAGIGIALAETSCRFKVPVTYPDELLIGTAVRRLEETEFLLQHALFSTKLDLIAAESTARMVYYDFASKNRVALTDAMQTVLTGHLLNAKV